jgi:hypothetical protein
VEESDNKRASLLPRFGKKFCGTGLWGDSSDIFFYFFENHLFTVFVIIGFTLQF